MSHNDSARHLQTAALRQLHAYAATPIIPDDFGAQGPLQEAAPEPPPMMADSLDLDLREILVLPPEADDLQVWNAPSAEP